MNGKYAVLHLSALMLLSGTVISCKKDNRPVENFPAPTPARLEVPGNLPKVADDADNPLSAEGIELGRILFYDARLSGNNKLSCASCHRQDIAFSDATALTSIGVSAKPLHRHTPTLFNLAWAKSGLFWDGGSKNLESQALGPLTSEDEMHQDLYELERELKAVPDYVKRFKLVFNREITSTDVLKALAQFQRTLISAGSRYDLYIRKVPGATLSSQELQGLALVNAKCGSCHQGELFTDYSYHNNGIDAAFPADLEGIYQGRYRVSFDLADMGKFKTPSLRNVMLTAPYMHDGRFSNLDQVLDHYRSGITYSATVDRALYQNNGNLGIPISQAEKAAIKAFLSALTDDAFTKNKKFSNPN
ncbi:cytochrome-c peroxidase [Pedobacter suwonensis]|uniref:cytochrome-c peroxidase n=1 Tax=Pedobacter suwonensis TaxID=332999 RepID=UPI0011A4740D|nr:cytochrome c peroxidase [Pedobacter suwonensis]